MDAIPVRAQHVRLANLASHTQENFPVPIIPDICVCYAVWYTG
jgi:hypothetical protein